MTATTLTVRVHIAWWLRPYLYALAFFAAMMGTDPDPEKLGHVFARAIRVVPC